MKFFYDTEFIENGPDYPLTLISIGIVSEGGREYYAANAAIDISRLSPWLKENVVTYLPPRESPDWKSTHQIAQEIIAFVGQYTPEWWSNYAAYDHVILCQLFGTMSQLPTGWPMFTHDIQQWRSMLGNPELPPQTSGMHHALEDARYVRDLWHVLNKYADNKNH